LEHIIHQHNRSKGLENNVWSGFFRDSAVEFLLPEMRPTKKGDCIILQIYQHGIEPGIMMKPGDEVKEAKELLAALVL